MLYITLFNGILLTILACSAHPHTPKSIVFLRGIVGLVLCMMWAYKTGQSTLLTT